MTGFRRAVLNGLVALLVATTVAYVVGRDRETAVAAGLLSGVMTFVSSWIAGDRDGGVPAGV